MQSRCLLLLLFALAGAQASAQNVTHAHPSCLTPGQSQRVTFFGTGLAGIRQIWRSFPGRAIPATDPAPTDTAVAFDIEVAPSVEPGIYGWRAVTDVGMSDLKLLVIDTLPRQVEMGNNIASQPQKIAVPSATSGFILPEEVDYYTFEGTVDQRLTIEVVGHRLGTGLDPLIRLVGPDGKELLVHDNDDGFDFDLRTAVVLPAAGAYRLEVRDARYQGGLWPYVLRLGDFPAARVVFPPSLAGSRSFTLLGPAGHDFPPVTTPGFLPSTGLFKTLRAASPQGTAWMTLANDPSPAGMEAEPNNSPLTANAFQGGQPINGQLGQPGDVDFFRIRLQNTQSLCVRAVTRRLGSPADLYLRLLDPAGNEVASADDKEDEDAELVFTANAEGWHTIAVEDLNRRGGSEFVYHLRTLSPHRDISLQPSGDTVVVPRGTSMPIPLAAVRQNDSSLLSLSIEVEGEAAGLSARPSEVLPTSNQGVLVIDAAPTGPATTSLLRLRGTTVEAEPRSIPVKVFPIQRLKLDQVVLFPPELEDALAVAVVDPPFFRLAAQPPAAGLPRFASASIEVVAQRDKFADDPITLTVENLPPQITATLAPIEKGKRSVTLNLESKQNSPLGPFPIWVTGTSTFAGRSVRVASEVVSLVVRPAITLTFGAAETTIGAGSKQTVVVKADRLAGVNAPLTITWPNLPAGVTAAAGTMAEGTSEVGIELAVDASVTPQTFEGMIARTTYTVNGQNESVDTPPLRLTVSAAP